jgi:hypothetical protein
MTQMSKKGITKDQRIIGKQEMGEGSIAHLEPIQQSPTNHNRNHSSSLHHKNKQQGGIKDPLASIQGNY